MEQKTQCYAEIHLPRRKKVWEVFHSNSFRIFDETLPERLDPASVCPSQKCPSGSVKESESRNVPHPHNASFIRTNVRFLNQPIAHMENTHTQEEHV